MQTVKIDIYISDLLYSYDCVIIPDFGGFVANYTSASIQSVQHKISPPSKKISFNRSLKTNDGLLSNHIAERRSISYEEANDLIKSFVNYSIEGLRKGDKIKIEKVGTLFLDTERKIQFIAEDQNDFLLDSFGLGSLRVQPIQRESTEDRIEKKIKKVIPIVKEQEKKKRKIYWPAAAILLFLFAFSFLLNQQYNWLESAKVNYAAFGWDNTENAFYEERVTTNLKVELENEKTELDLVEGIVPYKISNKEATNLFVDNRSEDAKSRIDNTEVVSNSISKELRFHVMGGCFSNRNNAERLVKKLSNQGFNARLLGDYKNLHAVSFGSFTNRKEALALLTSVKRKENSSAWLLVKLF